MLAVLTSSPVNEGSPQLTEAEVGRISEAHPPPRLYDIGCPTVEDAIAAAYPDAADLASKESRLPPETFPAQCPYSTEQLLQDDFSPGFIGTTEAGPGPE